MAEMQQVYRDGAEGQPKSIKSVVNLLGAVTSLALVVGVGVWGYKLVIRDVSGVPVIRAAEGPMRIQPEDPGGRQALHQGLSVNDVAAEGTAAKPADRLILAPEPLDLSLEDTQLARLDDRTTTVTVGEAESGEEVAQDDTPMRFASVEALAESLAEGVEPLQELPAAEPVEEEELEERDSPPVEGGIGRSLRPKLRPSSLVTSPEGVAMAAVANASARDVDPSKIPVGTRLAQLGAFSSHEIAVQEWDKLADRFDEYLEDKDRVIEKATSGGRTFYRLRAMGFADLSDARRFCSALVAERAECIPVVTR
ncbi:SPOR domain-containing protein [Roseovarius indicus]|uniref:SPOR domain-containing protein n=1 Tax=Roseovarius indicus TaxID=540747 RepID=UPI0032EF0D79